MGERAAPEFEWDPEKARSNKQKHCVTFDGTMKKTFKHNPDPDMASEYDFSGGVRGKYAGRFAAGSKIVVISPDIAQMSPDSAAVNKALRRLVKPTKRVPVAKTIKGAKKASRLKGNRG